MISQDISCYHFFAAFLWLGRLPCRSGSRGGDVAITSPFFCSDCSLYWSPSAEIRRLRSLAPHLNNQTGSCPSRVEHVLSVVLLDFGPRDFVHSGQTSSHNVSPGKDSYWSVLCEMRIEREGSRRKEGEEATWPSPPHEAPTTSSSWPASLLLLSSSPWDFHPPSTFKCVCCTSYSRVCEMWEVPDFWFLRWRWENCT